MTYDLQPTLNGKLLFLRPIAAADFEALFAVASDPGIWDQHPFPRYNGAAFAEFFHQAVESKSGLVVLDQSTNKMIGASRYYKNEEGHLSIGYTFLARSHWGGKFNRELKTLMLEHAFQYVSEIYFDIGENNQRSRRAIEKIGASLVKLQMLKGQPYTLYRIDQESFRAGLNR